MSHKVDKIYRFVVATHSRTLKGLGAWRSRVSHDESLRIEFRDHQP
jgi:hypothetical protein